MNRHPLLTRESILLQALIVFSVVWPPRLFQAAGWESAKQAVSEGDPLRQVVHGSILAIGALLLLGRGKTTILTLLGANRWLWIFTIYILLSVIWSYDSVLSLKRGILLFEVVLVGLAFLSKPNSDRHILTTIRPLLTTLVFGSIAYSLLFPQYGVHLGDAWRGLTAHKNTLGQLALLCSLVWIGALLERTRRLPVCLLMILITSGAIFMSRSTSNILALLLAFGFLSVVSCTASLREALMPGRSLPFWGFFCALGLLMVVLVWHGFGVYLGHASLQDLYEWTVSSAGKDLSLTGRSYVWSSLLDEVAKHPWLGAGYQSFWNIERAQAIFRELHWLPSHGHNGYLDILNELGIIGIALLFFVFIAHTHNLLKLNQTRPLLARQHGMLFVVALFLNGSESLFFLRIQELWSAIVLLSMLEVSWLTVSYHTANSAPNVQPAVSARHSLQAEDVFVTKKT